jgi:hypothetical protein
MSRDSVCREKSPSVPVGDSPADRDEVQNGGAAAQDDFDDNAVDYECDDLALEVNKEEFLDLMEEDDEEAGRRSLPSGCFYCDDVTVEVSDRCAFANHLKEVHSVRKNVDFLAEVTSARQPRGNLCCAHMISS